MTMFIGVNTNASITSLLTDPDTTKGYTFYGVPIATSVNYSGLRLKLTGTGLSAKKVGVSRVKVFVLQYFSEHPEKLVRTETGALASVKDLGHTAIKLTFIRNVDSTMVHDAINDYLTNNIPSSEYGQYKSDIDTMLNAIKSDDSFSYDSSITIAANQGNVVYENTAGRIITLNSVNKDLTTKLFSMFIGNTKNNEEYTLKMQMISDPLVMIGEFK